MKKRPVAVASVFGNDDSDEDEEEMPEHARKDTQPFVHHLIFWKHSIKAILTNSLSNAKFLTSKLGYLSITAQKENATVP